jgi:hypothetical protein
MLQNHKNKNKNNKNNSDMNKIGYGLGRQGNCPVNL